MLAILENSSDVRVPLPLPVPARARRVRPTPALSVMQRDDPDGTPLRLIDLVRLTGFTKPKLIDDIKRGYLAADPVPCGRQHIWIIQFREAQRYLRSIGIL